MGEGRGGEKVEVRRGRRRRRRSEEYMVQDLRGWGEGKGGGGREGVGRELGGREGLWWY